MKPISLLAALIAILAPASAGAGGYISAGVGTSPNLGGELDNLSSEGRSGRVALGLGFGPVAVEGGLGGFGVTGVSPGGDSVDGTVLSAGVSVKLLAEVISNLSVFARGGLGRTWVTGDWMDSDTGQTYVLGVGLEYLVPLPVADIGFWAEVDREWLNLAQAAGTYSGTADTFLLGVRVGI